MTSIPRQAETLADLVCLVRPEWDRPGVIAALRDNWTRGSLPELALAAVRAAADQGSRTPKAIGHTQHWLGGPIDRSPVPPPINQLCIDGRELGRCCDAPMRPVRPTDYAETTKRNADKVRAEIRRHIEPHAPEEAS